MLINDIYILKESDPFEIEMNEEATVNLGLEKVPPCYHTLLTGCVHYKDLPLKNATVLVLDNRFKPLFHTVTNEKGVFKFRNLLSPGEYNVIATAIGYKTSKTKSIRINTKTVKVLSFSLKKSFACKNGTIYGRIFEVGSTKQIENASISLFPLADSCLKIYKTKSNHNGQYLIYYILPGRYKMIIKKQGYKASSIPELTIAKNDCFILNIDLIRKTMGMRS